MRGDGSDTGKGVAVAAGGDVAAAAAAGAVPALRHWCSRPFPCRLAPRRLRRRNHQRHPG